MAISCTKIRTMGMEDFIEYVLELYRKPIVPIDEFCPETVEIAGKYWTVGPISVDDNGSGIYVAGLRNTHYYTLEAIERIVPTLPKGWRIPTLEEFFDGACYLGAIKDWVYHKSSNNVHEKYYQYTRKFIDSIGGFHWAHYITRKGVVSTDKASDIYLTSSRASNGNYCLVEVMEDDDFVKGVMNDYRMRSPYATADKGEAYQVILVKDKK